MEEEILTLEMAKRLILQNGISPEFFKEKKCETQELHDLLTKMAELHEDLHGLYETLRFMEKS